jgi:hypothetical protein
MIEIARPEGAEILIASLAGDVDMAHVLQRRLTQSRRQLCLVVPALGK